MKTWQFHKLKLPAGLAGEGGAGVRQRRPGRDRGPAAPGDGDPGRDLGRRGLDDLAAPPELPAGHGADRSSRRRRAGSPSGTSGSASRSTRRCPRSGASAPRHGRRCPTAGPSRRSSRPAGGVSQLHFEDTELSGAYQVKIGPPLALESTFAANPDPAESDPAKLDRAGLADGRPGLELRLLDQLEGADRQRRRRSAAAASCTDRCSTPSWFLLSSNRSSPGGSDTTATPRIDVLMPISRISPRYVMDWLLRRSGRPTGSRTGAGRRGDRARDPLRAALAAGGHAAGRARLRGADRLALPPRGPGPARPTRSCWRRSGSRSSCWRSSCSPRRCSRSSGPACPTSWSWSTTRPAQQVVDQYDDAEDEGRGRGAGQGRRASPSRRRLAVGEGLLAQDDGQLLRELQKQNKVRLYLVSTARAAARRDRQARGRRPARSRSSRRSSPPAVRPGSATAVRQVLTELRGAPRRRSCC